MYHRQQYGGPHRQEPQIPTFDVSLPFMGVYTVRGNHAFSMHMQSFIDDVDDVDEEILALREALYQPVQKGNFSNEECAFSVLRSFKGIVNIKMNEGMRKLLVDFISEVEGPLDRITFAFKGALTDPAATQQKFEENAHGGHRRRRGPGYQSRHGHYGGSRDNRYSDQPSSGYSGRRQEDDIVDE